jgi:flagellar basal-body rod modification protein FlgD
MATISGSTASSVTSLAPEIQKALDGVTIKQNKQTLNQDDFLRLLTVQLQNQDPLKPMEEADFMGQMAQFASLEQTRELNKNFASFTQAQSLNSAQIYLGRKVTLTDPSGAAVSGLVSAVKLNGGIAQIVIDGKTYATDTVTEIENITGTTTK